MNFNRDQLSQLSGSTRSTSLATATGHPNHPHAPVHQTLTINPLHTLKDPSEAHRYLSRLFPTHILQSSPNLSDSSSISSHATAAHLPIISVQAPSTRHSPLQLHSTRTSLIQLPSIPLPHDDTRSVPSKRAREYTPDPPALYPASSNPRQSQLHPTEPSLERPAKKQRLDTRRSSTATNRRGPQPLGFLKPSPPSRPSTLGAIPPKPEPRPKKAPLHPLAVDYGRPIKPVVPQPPFCRLSLRQNRIPLSPYPENEDPKSLLADELKGPVDPVIAQELGDLMWMQQKRVWDNLGGYSDPFLCLPIPTSLLNIKSLGSWEGVATVQSGLEATALYGPPSRINESTRLGESLTNPNIIVLDDDEDGGFEQVLDLYRGAVEGSTLSMELELAVGGDAGLIEVDWETASSLEVSVERRSSTPAFSGEPQGSRIRTLVEYKKVVEAEKVSPPLEQAIPGEEPPLGIEWVYGSCGYASGRVVNTRRAKTRR